MTQDYSDGFSAGFAAAIQQGLPRSTRTIAEGFEVDGNRRRIVIALSDETFEVVRDRAYHNQQSFAAEARAIIDCGLKVAKGASPQR